MKYLSFKIMLPLLMLHVATEILAKTNLKKLNEQPMGKSNAVNMKTAEIIFTKNYYPNFDAAKPNAIQEVMDGDSLWMFVKLDKPLKNYVYTQKVTTDDGSVKKLSHFHLGIGPQGEESDYETVRIWVGEHGEVVSSAEGLLLVSTLEESEFKLCLTEFKKNLSTKLFIGLVGNGDAGIWKNEIRFYRGITEAGADNPALGAGKITCNVDDGIPKYRAMWKTYNEVLEKGSADDNVLPKRSNFEDDELKSMIIKDLQNNGLDYSDVYFSQPMGDYTNQDGERLKKAQAVYVYKKEGKCFFGFVYPTQELTITGNWTAVKLNYEGSGFPINCE